MKKVMIEVRRGIAAVLNKPKGIELIIIDYDNNDNEEGYSEEVIEGEMEVKNGKFIQEE